ncbi:helix-turn-helix domain-containing protein [Spirosoma validum]|uniref:AraC family transcriptional regulator n=1 Tax=Spirosoma validum TaxID=2771355 RepID=A0A927GF20_9BACT|nr:helix-turn-helix domain-containing protein [Spirosoma validum]MBD2755273.1 AraC family transcriptional regulator [Spirosoma validum]
MNIFDYRLPSPALQDYVRQYQIVGLSFAPSVVVPIKPYWPRPENCLGFYPRGGDVVERPNGTAQKWPTRSVVVGQQTSLVNRQPPNEFVYFQVVFQPGALSRLTGIPAHELTNVLEDGEAIFSPEIRLVNERLSSTDDHLEMIDIVERFLYYLIRKQLPHSFRTDRQSIDKVGQYLLQNPSRFGLARPGQAWPGPGGASLDWLAEQACLSPKQFYNLFTQRMGISPKLYARIARFDQSVKLKNAQPTKDWLSIALELGYHDYQHLVRDYKEFTHLTPTLFNQRESHAPERSFGKAEI